MGVISAIWYPLPYGAVGASNAATRDHDGPVISAAGGDVRRAGPAARRRAPVRAAAVWRKNKLTASEYDVRDDLVAAGTWMAFVTQRPFVASQLSMAKEAAEALGLSVAADPRAQ